MFRDYSAPKKWHQTQRMRFHLTLNHKWRGHGMADRTLTTKIPLKCPLLAKIMTEVFHFTCQNNQHTEDT
jgi:hypothetical protein